MSAFLHTVLALSTWGARGFVHSFVPPCPHLIRHVHKRSADRDISNFQSSWNDPVKKAARLAKGEATRAAKGTVEPWRVFVLNETP